MPGLRWSLPPRRSIRGPGFRRLGALQKPKSVLKCSQELWMRFCRLRLTPNSLDPSIVYKQRNKNPKPFLVKECASDKAWAESRSLSRSKHACEAPLAKLGANYRRQLKPTYPCVRRIAYSTRMPRAPADKLRPRHNARPRSEFTPLAS